MIGAMLRYRLPLLLFLLVLFTGTARGNSYEKRVAGQLLEGRYGEEVVWLQSGVTEFICLYRDYATARPRGAVILLHGMGGHPAWPEVVDPLRTRLPALGWATLSLQLPVLSPTSPVAGYGQTVEEARRRILAAVRRLQDWQYTNIVLVGYSFGAATAAHALGSGGLERGAAFAGISMQAQPFLSPRLKLLPHLEAIRIPVLDVYGSRDMQAVRRNADDRRLAARKNGNSTYQQYVIEGADHYYTGLMDALLKRLHGWLVKVAPGPVPVVPGATGQGGETRGQAGLPEYAMIGLSGRGAGRAR